MDGQFYNSLLKAIQEAHTSRMPVILYKDQLLPEEFLTLDGYTVTIDLNGKTLSVREGLPIRVTGGEVTLTNSQSTGGIAVSSGGNGNAIQVEGGSLTVESGVRLEGRSYGGFVSPAIEVTAGTVTLCPGATLVNGIRAPEDSTWRGPAAFTAAVGSRQAAPRTRHQPSFR